MSEEMHVNIPGKLQQLKLRISGQNKTKAILIANGENPNGNGS